MSITLIIVLLTALISYQSFNNRDMFLKLQHWPHEEANTNEYHRWLTSGFVHGSWMHLLINMYVLWIFGEAIEFRFVREFGPVMGRINFLLLYILTIVAANIPTYFRHRNNSSFASVGASGGVSGIVFAFILFYPFQQLLLFFILPMPAIIAGILFLGYSTYASRNPHDRIDHEAHFYGAVFGFIFTIVLKPALFMQFIQQLTEGLPF